MTADNTKNQGAETGTEPGTDPQAGTKADVKADVKPGPTSEETTERAPVAPKKRGPRRKVAALDLGGVRVGLALSDELGLYAHPRGVLDGRNRVALVQTLAALVIEENVGRFVVGLPLDMRGGEGEAARKARRLAQAIADATGCEIELWDERLSTVEARRHLAASDVHGARAKAHIDEASACILLQAWLDRKAARRSP